MLDTVALTRLLAVLYLVAGAASYVLGWYSWRRIDHPLSDRFAWVMIANGTWAILTLCQYVSPIDSLATLWGGPLAAVAALAAVFWFLFVVEYTDYADRLPQSVERLLLIEPVVFGIVETLNPGSLVYAELDVVRWGIFRLPYHDFGPLWLGQVLFNYALLLLSFVLLGSFFLKARNLYRKQTGLIFSIYLLLTISTVLFLSGLSPHPHLDITPLLFIVQAFGVSYALYQYDFLSVGPLAAHQLFEETVDPVFVFDTSRRVLDANDAARQYVQNETDATIADVTIDGLDAALAQTDGEQAVEHRGLEVTGQSEASAEPVTYDVQTTKLTDRFDVPVGYAIMLRDITTQKRQQERLSRQNERLDEFTGIVSHDLRNPLNVAMSNIELVRQRVDEPELEQVNDALEQMEQMISELLELAQKGQVVKERHTVEVAECARSAWENVETADATLSIDLDTTVRADPKRLQQLFENVFRNSLDHGHDAVRVAVVETADGFAVTDDGPGIQADKREQIFEMGTSYSEDGTGFGLAIVTQIVRAHNWTIEASESETGGARFDIRTG